MKRAFGCKFKANQQEQQNFEHKFNLFILNQSSVAAAGGNPVYTLSRIQYSPRKNQQLAASLSAKTRLEFQLLTRFSRTVWDPGLPGNVQ